jgi:adenylate cyclase ExoY
MGTITASAKAIADSGIVPGHIQPMLHVAVTSRAFILVRPVNEWATGLIAENYHTKGLHVKGKSSDWGPQAGFICVDQRLSKLARKEASAVPDYNKKVQESIAEKRAAVVPLVISRARFETLVKRNKIKETKAPSKDASSIFVTSGEVPGTEFELCPLPGGDESLKRAGAVIESLKKGGYLVRARQGATAYAPVMVLADPTTKIPLTADYDLYAIAPQIKRGQVSGTVMNVKEIMSRSFDQDLGMYTDREGDMVNEINKAVAKDAKYKGSAVCHHGPEVNNPSPEQDWPVTVLSPANRVFGILDQQTLEEVVAELLFLDFYFHTNAKYDKNVRQSLARKLENLLKQQHANVKDDKVDPELDGRIKRLMAIQKLDANKNQVEFQNRIEQVKAEGLRHLTSDAKALGL